MMFKMVHWKQYIITIITLIILPILLFIISMLIPYSFRNNSGNIFSNLVVAILATSTVIAPNAALADDKFVTRYREANLTLAAGETGFVVASCKAGYVAVGGGLTGYAPSIRLENTAPTYDGIGGSGWLVDVSNRTNATITTQVTVSAICRKGTYTIENVD